MILTKLKGGLGNQMFQYAAGRALALSNGTDLLLDLSYYPSQSLRTYSLDSFSIKARPASTLERLRAHFLYQKKVEKELAFDPTVLNARGSISLDGYWQSERYFASYASAIRSDFALKAPMSNGAEILAREISIRPSASVHIRRGDYVSNEKVNNVHGTCSPAYYKNAGELLVQKSSAALLFYIFSDDPEWAKANITLPGETRIASHSNISDAEELILISRCSHHISANSSFSWWGAWLNENPSKIVVAPKQWFTDPSRPTKDLIPPSWIQI